MVHTLRDMSPKLVAFTTFALMCSLSRTCVWEVWMVHRGIQDNISSVFVRAVEDLQNEDLKD